MNKKTLLHITTSLKIGGAETVLCDLIAGLGNKQFEHHVIYFYDGPKREQLQKLGVAMYHVTGLATLYDPLFWYRLFFCIKKIKPDGIHSLLWSANVASRVAAFFFHISHVSVYHNNIDQDGRFRNFLDYLTRPISKKLVAVSDEVADSIIAQDERYKKKDVTVIRNGIDANWVQNEAREQVVARSSLGIDDNQFVIGSVGRFCPVKNYSFLLEVFAEVQKKIPHARLVLVGVGPDEMMLKKRAEDLGIRTSVFFIIGQSAYGYYPLFDCFVQSSNKEGISIALLEALACGVPTIITNIKLKHEVVSSGSNGIVVGAENKKQFVQAILFLESNENMGRRYACAGKKTVKELFQREIMMRAYNELFQSLSL